MGLSTGFVILSHNDPDQLARLVATLDATYDRPAIAIHHNFSFSQVDRGRFGANVRFVEPNLATEWGDITLVHALLAALGLLYRQWSPDWFTMLSASDYPVMPGRLVEEKLRHEPYDLYLDWRRLVWNPKPIEGAFESHMGTHHVWYRRLAYERYVGKVILVPSLNRRLRPTRRRYVLRRPFAPFAPWWHCYGGETFFTGNAKVADILLRATTEHPWTFRHYAKTFAPDESIFHTLLCNHKELRICADNKRYTNWQRGGANPGWIAVEDLERIEKFGAFFARKFSSRDSGAVLAEIDRRLGLA